MTDYSIAGVWIRKKKNLSTLVNFKGSLLCKLVKKDM